MKTKLTRKQLEGWAILYGVKVKWYQPKFWIRRKLLKKHKETKAKTEASAKLAIEGMRIGEQLSAIEQRIKP